MKLLALVVLVGCGGDVLSPEQRQIVPSCPYGFGYAQCERICFVPSEGQVADERCAIEPSPEDMASRDCKYGYIVDGDGARGCCTYDGAASVVRWYECK